MERRNLEDFSNRVSVYKQRGVRTTLTKGTSSSMLVLYGRFVKMGSMSWTSVMLIAKFASRDRGLSLS